MPNYCWTPIPKFHALMMPLSLVAWLQKIWTVTLKSAKTKAKNEEIFKKNFFFSLYRSKSVCPFLENKKRILKFVLLQIKFFLMFFVKVSVIFWKCKLCLACGVRRFCAWLKLTIFKNWVSKNIPDQQKCVRFRKSKKVLNHSTLVYSTEDRMNSPYISSSGSEA